MSLKFVKTRIDAMAPTKGTDDSVGFDLYAAERVVVPGRGRAAVPTGVFFKIPEDCYGRVAGRSGLAFHRGIDVGGGVIDRDYTGGISVILFNHNDEEFVAERGFRIGQFICERVRYFDSCEEEQTYDETDRSSGGLGHTGGF